MRSILFRNVLTAFSPCVDAPRSEYWGVLKFFGKFSLGHFCVFCASPGNADRICRRCMDLLPWNLCFCECCGQPIAAVQPSGVSCADCQTRPPKFNCARSPLHYRFPVDTALKALKFQRQTMYAPAFATLLLPTLMEEFPNTDALVPVPLHGLRHVTRGFNQATEISRTLSKLTGLPLNHQTKRVRHTPKQAGLSSGKRQKNLSNAFAIDEVLRTRHPLIIDDVITTGATCENLAATLIAAGADSVNVLTVARASTN